MVRFRLTPVVVPVVAAVLAIAGCSKTSSTPESAATPGTPAAGQQAAAPASGQAPGAPAAAPAVQAKPLPGQMPAVMARVNGEEIGKADFDRALQAIEQRAGGPVPDDRKAEIYRGLLDQLIGLKLLQQEVRARKVAISNEEISKRMDEIKKQFPSEDAFKQTLAQQKVTLEKLQSDQRDDLAINKMLDAAIKDKITPSDVELKAFYETNPDRFKQPERVKASHILLNVPQGADAAAKAQVKAKAEGLLKQAKSGGDFAALAKANSQDPGSAINGGDLGFFTQGQMVPQFDQMAFKLKPGEISDLVETQFGYHIIKVVEKEPARTIPLDEVRPQLVQYLQNTNRQRETQAFVTALKAKGKVEIFI